jgi:hypothetical protein
MIPNYRNSEPIWGHNKPIIYHKIHEEVKRGHSEVAPARLVAAAYILDPWPYHMHIVN